jgi:uncharacterized protein (TIGR03382 family)
MRLGLASVVVVAALAARAEANGRPPSTSSIRFRQGHEATDIVAGMTFGQVTSHDGGATWEWMCEAAVGYGGMYDPDYSYSASGSIFATTPANGIKVARPSTGSCTFAAMPSGITIMSQDELGPDGALYTAAVDVSDSSIAKSTDDGISFPTSTTPGAPGDWWESLIVAPGNANIVFLSGYRDVGANRVLLLFESTNGGASFTPLPGNLANDGASASTNAGLATSAKSAIDFVGTSSDGGTLYARVTFQTANLASDGLYKLNTATDTTWMPVLQLMDSMAIVVRSSGDVAVITKTLGGQVSTNGGTSWTPLVNPPHANCLVENPADHTVWACTQNYTTPGFPGDDFGIMKTSDLSTWTGVLKFQDITKPVTCPTGTVQHDMCEAVVWCGLRPQLGITSTAIDCGATPDGASDAPKPAPPKKTGCCDAGGGGPTGLAGGALIAALLGRRRRRATSRS